MRTLGILHPLTVKVISNQRAKSLKSAPEFEATNVDADLGPEKRGFLHVKSIRLLASTKSNRP